MPGSVEVGGNATGSIRRDGGRPARSRRPAQRRRRHRACRRPRGQALPRATAPSEARARPHGAGRDARMGGRPAQAPAVPGRRPHGGVDRGGLHRARRGSLGQVRDPPAPLEGRGGRLREPSPRPVPARALRGAAGGPAELGVARAVGHGRHPAPHRFDHRGAHARARRLRGAVPARASRSRSWSSCTRSCRATTRWPSRPTSSWEGRTSSSTCSWGESCSAPTSRSRRSPSRCRCSEGLDGVQKMSQSLGNYVGISEPAEEQFGKLMSIPDGLIGRYLRLCTPLDPAEVDADRGRPLADGSLHPNDQKRRMARDRGRPLPRRRGGSARPRRGSIRSTASARFPTTSQRSRSRPRPSRTGAVWLPRLLVAAGLAGVERRGSPSVEQGGVRLDGEARRRTPMRSSNREELQRQGAVQVGRRRFARLVLRPSALTVPRTEAATMTLSASHPLRCVSSAKRSLGLWARAAPRTLRTEQCVRKPVPLPVRRGRGSPCHPVPDGCTGSVRSTSGGTRSRRSASGQCLPRPAELQHQIANPRAFGPGDSAISTESLILAQDERWRRA